MPNPQPQGSRWRFWLRSAACRVALFTGILLSALLVAWLVIANRVPALAPLAELRNVSAAAAGGVLMLIPVLCFLRKPGQLFTAGLIAWAVLTFTYVLAGFAFERLHTRMSPFHFFMLGAALYGAVAVTAWVASLILAARHEQLHPHSMAAARRRAS